MILMIDNYDSFTWNLVQLIGSAGCDVEVVRNDKISVDEALELKPRAIVISPGPGMPINAGICLELVKACAKAHQPVFGVCLGLQSMAQALGGDVIRAGQLMHGKVSNILHEGEDYFLNLPSSFIATRYHSLVACPETLPREFKVIARTADDQEIMAIAHKTLPMGAVQFHPESIAAEHGGTLFQNFLTWADSVPSDHPKDTAS